MPAVILRLRFTLPCPFLGRIRLCLCVRGHLPFLALPLWILRSSFLSHSSVFRRPVSSSSSSSSPILHLTISIPYRTHPLGLATPYPTSSSTTWPDPRGLNPSPDPSPLNLNLNPSLQQSHTTPRLAVQFVIVSARLHHPSSTLLSLLVKTTQTTATRSRMSPPTMKASSLSNRGNANARLRHPCRRPPCQIQKETPRCQITVMPLPCVTVLHSQ